MKSRFDVSWDMIPHDGAAAPVSPSRHFDRTEYDELYRAWCQERHRCIEMHLVLDEALRFLGRISDDGAVAPASRSRAKKLLKAIRGARRGLRDDGDTTS